MTEQKMKGMVAIVTGSSSGIGAGIAIEYSRLGAQVTISGRKEDKLKAVAKECEDVSIAKHKPLVIIGDVTDEAVRTKIIEDTIKQFGRIDVLINNAGTSQCVAVQTNAGLGPLDAMLDIHVRVPYHLSKLAIPSLIEAKGAIINISSVASFKPCGAIGLESGAAKAALDQITKWFAYELGAKGVRVNSINPGAVRTDIVVNSGYTQQDSDATWASMAQYHAMQRVGEIEEVAKVAAFLACKDSSFVTGAILPVDGGFAIMPTNQWRSQAGAAAPPFSASLK